MKPEEVKKRTIEIVTKIALPMGSYCICGGAAMELHGIRSNRDHDIDLLCTDAVYEAQALDNHYWTLCELSERGERQTLVRDGTYPKTELLPEGHFEERDIKGAIDRAVMIEGLPVISLPDLLHWKEGANRAKDLRDIELLKRAIGEKP